MKYKIVFPGSRKSWTEDLELVKEYAKVLENDCPHLYAQSEILIDNGNKIEVHKLSEWLEAN
jgi:hypothetical protein